MAYTSKQKSVVYIDRGGMSFFEPQTEQVMRFNFQNTFYHDLEITNVEEFQKQLTQFIQASKLQPAIVTIVLCPDFIFELVVPKNEKIIFEDEKEKFIDSVPFEQVTLKIFPKEKESLIIATNKTLYSIVNHVLELNGFQIRQIVPMTMLIRDNSSLSQGFTVPNAKSLSNAQDKYGEYNLIEQISVTSGTNIPGHPNSKFKVIHILIIVFVLLICILGYLLLRPPDPLPVTNTPPAATPIALLSTAVLPTETISSSSASAAISINTVEVQISGSSANTTQAQEIRSNLSALGITSIEVQSNSTVTASRTLVIMKQSLTQDIKDRITTEIRKTYQDISVQESQEGSYDVIVNLANL